MANLGYRRTGADLTVVEGELVFVTSKDAKNIQADEADSYILGYTIGNDLSCRFFQLPNHSGGQFFFAKAFDKFAPIGPLLVSTEQYNATAPGRRQFTRVNGKVVQDVEIAKDMIFTPGQILSHMSRGSLAHCCSSASLDVECSRRIQLTIPFQVQQSQRALQS